MRAAQGRGRGAAAPRCPWACRRTCAGRREIARDALDRERPRRHGAQSSGVRQHPAADARVDVAADAARGRRGRDLGDRVDDAVGVRRRARRRRARWRRRSPRPWRRGRRAGFGVDVDEHGLDAEVVRGLVERRVRRGRAAPSSGRSTSGRPVAGGLSTASRIDSVPPEVTDPANPSGASSRPPAKPTRSFSICSSDGNAVGSSPLERGERRDRLAADRSASARPES